MDAQARQGERQNIMCEYCDRNGRESILYSYESDVIFDDESKLFEKSEILYDESGEAVIENTFVRDGHKSVFEFEIKYCPMCGKKL